MAPGTRATVLVALATTAAAPEDPSAANNAGNVSSVPPPAMALIAPASIATRHSNKYSDSNAGVLCEHELRFPGGV